MIYLGKHILLRYIFSSFIEIRFLQLLFYLVITLH